MKSLQDQFAPLNKCFGCGPSNDRGLQIKSYAKEDSLVAEFRPQPHHQAFENVLSGGIVGTLLDCHSNWCAAYTLMTSHNMESPPCTVTAHFAVDLLAPTPMDKTIVLTARPRKISERKVEVDAELRVGDVITARCFGKFVAVNPGHPGYHRW